MRHAHWGIGFILAAGLPLAAQTLGEITGEIQDPSGAVVAGALVKATNSSTGAARVTRSNQAGIYSLPSLTPGIYGITVEAAGFQTVKRENIELHVQQTARVDFSLQVGEVAEVADVSGDAPLLNTEKPTVGTVIENRRIVELPLNGRNFLQLLALAPHVNFGFGNNLLSGGAFFRQGGSRSAQNIAIAGQRSEFNRFSLDGIDNTDVNFNTYILLPSVDALQEFQVQAGIYPAEFGREASQVIVSTRPGGNQFHGALFEFLRNQKLDAKPYAFAGPREKDPFQLNQYGFTLSGPVRIPKLVNGVNRLFFMSNFEGYRDRKHILNVFSVPSAAMRTGDFSAVSIFDPATRARSSTGAIVAERFANNRIPSAQFDPTSLRLLEFYPGPNSPGLVSNLQQSPPRRIDKDQFNQRIDLVESSASTWFGRFGWADELELDPANQANQVTRLNGVRVLTNVKQAMVSNSRALRPSLVNEFRFGVSRFFNQLQQELAFQRDVVGELKIPVLPSLPPIGWGIPLVFFSSGFANFGSALEGPYVGDDRVYQWTDAVSWIRGRHSLRFGAEIRRDMFDQTGNGGLRGQFNFNAGATQNPAAPTGTGSVFADYLLGQIFQSRGSGGLGTVLFRATSQYYFVQDDWKLRPNLTLSLGARYEYTPPWFDQSGTLINAYVPFVDTAPNVADLARHPTLIRTGSGDFYEGAPVRLNPAVPVARDGRLGDRLIAADHNDFAPRLGVAWSPSSRWTVRAGSGVFYSQDSGGPRFDMARNLPGARADSTDSSFPSLNWDRPFLSITQVSTPTVLANVYGRRTPYSIQYLFNVQRQLAKETVLEIGYLGSVSRKLELLRFFNQAVPGTSPLSTRKPYPEFGGIQEVDGSGKAYYNSLAVKLQRRFYRGLTYLAGYTWSRSMDNASAIRIHQGDPWFPENSNCLRCEWGRSNFDATQRFVTSGFYELPFGQNPLLGGWQLGSILTLQTGFPFTVQNGSDLANAGAANSRPNATGVPANLPADQRTTERFFNTLAFARQPVGSGFGNLGRNNLIGPGLLAWDFSTLKDMRVREGQKLQFRFEAFNFPNHPNWDIPGHLTGASTGSPEYGKIRLTRTAMRELQFGVKWVF